MWLSSGISWNICISFCVAIIRAELVLAGWHGLPYRARGQSTCGVVIHVRIFHTDIVIIWSYDCTSTASIKHCTCNTGLYCGECFKEEDRFPFTRLWDIMIWANFLIQMTQKNSDKSRCKWLCKGKSDFMMVSVQFIVNSQEGIKAAAFLTEMIREGFKNKIKKKYGIFHTFFTPPPSGGVKYGIYLWFFLTSKGQICVVFWCISQQLGSGKKGFIGTQNYLVAQKWNGMWWN